MVSNAESAKAAYAPPIMATIFPTSGTVTGGDLITITGQNLRAVNSIQVGGNTVYWDDIEKSQLTRVMLIVNQVSHSGTLLN